MGGKSDTPPPPDYSAAARETATGNLEMARAGTAANRPTQITPFGESSWYNTPGTDDWVNEITLDPKTQQALDSQQDVQTYLSNLGTKYMGRVEDTMDQPYADQGPMENQPDLGAMPDMGFGAVQGIQDAMMSRLNPALEKRRAQQQQRAAAMGLTVGSEAENDIQHQLSQGENDANQQALLGAMGAYKDITGRQVQGRQEQMAEYAQRMQGRQQKIQEQAYERSIPLNELNAILRGQNVGMPQFGQFNQQQTTAGPNMSGAVDNQYMASLGQGNSGPGMLGGAAQGAAAGSVLGPWGMAAGGIIGGIAGSR